MPYILLALSILLGSYNFWSHSQKNERIRKLESDSEFFREIYNERDAQLRRSHERFLDLSERATRFRKGISNAIFSQDFSYTHDVETGKCKLYPNQRLAPFQTLRRMDHFEADQKDYALYAYGDEGC